jgi:hydroxyacylglutathione hydrolase
MRGERMPATAITIKRFVLGPLETNTYVLLDGKTRHAAVIDPAAEDEGLFRYLKSNAFAVDTVLLTHGHYDHIAGIPGLKSVWKPQVGIHPLDAGMLAHPSENLSIFLGLSFHVGDADFPFEDGMEIQIGSVRIKVLHTPGHTPGSVCFAGEGFALTGDTLFLHSVGRTDFRGSSMDRLLHSIREKLMPLGDDVRLFPGHGDETTIGNEKNTNPFLATDAGGI